MNKQQLHLLTCINARIGRHIASFATRTKPNAACSNVIFTIVVVIVVDVDVDVVDE